MNQLSTHIDQILIRKARESDTVAITKLKAQLDRLHRLLGLWPPEGGSRQHLLRYRKLVRQPTARLFVAEGSSHEVIGYLTAFIQTRNCDRDGFRRVGVIGEAFVQGQYRSRGIGASLVNAAVCFFLSRGIRHVSLRNAVGNELANRFWDHLAFRPVLYTRTATLDAVQRALEGEQVC